MTTAAEFEGTIQPWGNSLGLRITKTMGRLARLSKGTKVSVQVTDAGLLVRPKRAGRRTRLPFTEKQLVEGLTPEKAHADELPVVLPAEYRG